MSLKARILFTSELNPTIVIKDDFGDESTRVGSEALSKLIKPRFDVLIDFNGVELREVYAPNGEPQPGRLAYLAIGFVIVLILLLVASRKK